MKIEQKARQLALTLVGEDQNPEPLIEVLIEMAKWQRERMMNDGVEGICISVGSECGSVIAPSPLHN